MADILEGGKRDTSSQTPSFAVTNITQDLALNCDEEAGALHVADVLGTLIRELIRQGIIHGTVA
jgi:hypothetical protein